MHYIITDIHNDSWRFMKLLEKIDLKEEDHLYLLGDLFDRCMDHPDPAGVYFQVLKLGKKCTVIRGNHDHWLANYISAITEWMRETAPSCSRIRTIPSIFCRSA